MLKQASAQAFSVSLMFLVNAGETRSTISQSRLRLPQSIDEASSIDFDWGHTHIAPKISKPVLLGPFIFRYSFLNSALF